MALRYWRGTGDGNWGTTTNWSDTSGGATGFSIPTASDDVIFDGSGNLNCVINTSARVCLSFTITSAYTATINHAQQLTVSGNITLGANYTITGSGLLVIGASSIITTNGRVWPNSVTLSNTTGQTYTLADTFNITGTLTIGTGAVTTFAGSAGFTCGTLLNQSTSSTTVNLKDGVIYTITTLLNCFTTRVGSPLEFISSDLSSKAFIILNSGATCQCLANFTRINATGGRLIRTFNGIATDSPGVISFYDLRTATLSK
jgi:hypothetical protein